jgi:hypothetical protein
VDVWRNRRPFETTRNQIPSSPANRGRADNAYECHHHISRFYSKHLADNRQFPMSPKFKRISNLLRARPSLVEAYEKGMTFAIGTSQSQCWQRHGQAVGWPRSTHSERLKTLGSATRSRSRHDARSASVRILLDHINQLSSSSCSVIKG